MEPRGLAAPERADLEGRHPVDGQGPEPGWEPGAGEGKGQSDPEPGGRIDLDEVEGLDLDGGRPIKAATRHGLAQEARQGLVGGKAYQGGRGVGRAGVVAGGAHVERLDHGVGGPERRVMADKEDGLEIDERLALEPGDGPALEDGDGEVDFVAVEP